MKGQLGFPNLTSSLLSDPNFYFPGKTQVNRSGQSCVSCFPMPSSGAWMAGLPGTGTGLGTPVPRVRWKLREVNDPAPTPACTTQALYYLSLRNLVV